MTVAWNYNKSSEIESKEEETANLYCIAKGDHKEEEEEKEEVRKVNCQVKLKVRKKWGVKWQRQRTNVVAVKGIMKIF